LENQDSKTNSENVSFIAYLDKNDRSKNQISKNIDAEDLSLFVTLRVQGGGKLENSKIEFSNSNFELRDEKNTFEKTIGTILSEKGVTIELPIVARKDSNYNLSLLNMVSEVKLTGEYIDNNGNVTDINTTKKVNIEWTTNEITEEQVTLSQEVITNRIYNIEGTNKRIVQVLVKSNINESKAPIKTTKIEIQNPEIGTAPEQVKVIAKNTLATNGKSNIEFANSVDSKYEYKQEEGKTYIEVLNNPNAENNISWTKNTADEFIITYIYNEETQILPFTSKAKSTLELYGRTNGVIEKENEITLDNIETVGSVDTLDTAITNRIYKGNMYIGEDTDYQTAWGVFVSYPELAKKIVLQDTTEQETENLSTYYKTTKINKAQALELLGEEGTIKVYNAENMSNPLTEIKLAEENEEYITINYQTKVNKIVIETTKAVKEGKLEILNDKAISVLKTEGIEKISKLSSSIKLLTEDGENKEVTNIIKSSTADLLEPKTTIEVNLDKNEISNQVENTLRLTAVLKTQDNSNKLFKNPTISVELPAEITEVTLDNIALLYEEELKMKSSDVVTNENGIKVLKIELEGEQTKYNAQEGATIVADLKLKAENFMANKNVELKTVCVNGEEKAETTNNLNIVAKTGILNSSTIKIGDNVVEELNNTVLTNTIQDNSEILIGTKLINNNGQEITNANILGTLPEGVILNSEIATDTDKSKVYYSTEENAQENSTTWVNTPDNYNNVKTFKIELGEQEQADTIELAYKVKIDENALNEKDQFENNVNINYMLENQEKQDKITFKLVNTAKEGNLQPDDSSVGFNVILSVRPKTTLETFYEGQIVTYEIEVINTGAEAINNAVLKYQVPEGAVYTEFTYSQGTDIQFTDNTELKNKEWNIEKIAPNETITKEATIRIKQGTEKITAIAYLDCDNVDYECSCNEILVEKGNLEVKLSRVLNCSYTFSGGDKIQYFVIVENKSEKNMTNIKVNAKIPNLTSYLYNSEYNENWLYDETNNTLTANIETLNAGETEELIFEVQISQFNNDITSGEIRNTIIVTDDNGVSYESNEYITKLLLAKWEIEQKVNSNETLSSGKEIIYTIEVKNVGEKGSYVIVEDTIPQEIFIDKVSKAVDDEEPIIDRKIWKDNKVEIGSYLEVDQILKIEIEGIVLNLDKDTKEKTITNKALINLNEDKYIESNEIVSIIINKDWEEPEKNPEEPVNPDEPEIPTDPDEPVDPDKPETPTDPENPVDPEEDPDEPENPEETQTYSISGLAWLDENKNGIKDNNEEVLKGIEVILLDKQANPVKDKDENVISTVTEVTGTYKFNNLEKGEYIVAFIYDTSKYTVTKYQVESAKENENSDAISKNIIIDGSNTLVGATDIISLEKEDKNNIDIGLVENAKFDLSLEKYVSKVVVTNSSESVNYNFGESALAKIEIATKRLAGSTILVQYEIKVSNEGDVTGYVGDILDYMPKELEFNSEMNPDWYLDTNQILHNKTLEKTALEPGKTQTVKLVLTKTLSNNSTGTIENIAEIGTATNLEEIKDIDSTPGNKQTGEDDIANASLIISIKTGGPGLYIGIVLISLAVLGTAIYLINKKILKGGM
jgi:uncharacterized repeat protein (TIGR01451 family)